MEQPSPYRYDVFLSASDADLTWLETTLLPRLEQAGLTCIYKERFRPGAIELDEIERAVRESRHTLLLLTPDWVKDNWSAFAGKVAQARDPAARWRRVIPALVKPCAPPDAVKLLHWVDLTAAGREEQEIARIIDAVKGTGALPELHYETLPTFAERKRELRWFALAGGAALLTLLLLGGWIFYQWQQAHPTEMPEVGFNVAVAEFAAVDEHGASIQTNSGRQEASEIAGWLNLKKDALEKIVGRVVNVWGPAQGIGMVDERVEARAKELRADVLIYGTLRRSAPDEWVVEPAFYLTHKGQLQNAEELNGEHRLGAGIKFHAEDPGDARRVNLLMQARTNALYAVILALAEMRGGDAAGYANAARTLTQAAGDFEAAVGAECLSAGDEACGGPDVIYLFLGSAYLNRSTLVSDRAERDALLGSAVDALETALGKNPQYPRARNGLGYTLYQQARPFDPVAEPCAWNWERLDAATAHFQRALDAPAGDKPPTGYVDLRAHTGLARIYYTRGFCQNQSEWDTAQMYYERALTEYNADPKEYLADLGAVVYIDLATMDLYRAQVATPEGAQALRASAVERYGRGIDLALAAGTGTARKQALGAMPFLLTAYCMDGKNAAAQAALDDFVKRYGDPAARGAILAGLKQGCVQ